MTVPSGAALVYVGQTIQVYDTTLTTNRGSCNVVAADPITAQTITVDSLPAGTVATDVIVHDGLSRRAAGFALRRQVPPEQRDHRHLAQPQSRHLSAATRHAARQRRRTRRWCPATCAWRSTRSARRWASGNSAS